MTAHKICFAFQNLPDNDNWAPNSTSLNFMPNGIKCQSLTHDFGMKGNIPPSTIIYPKLDNEFLFDQVTYKHLPLVNDQKYIYPICLVAQMYFINNKSIGFDLIDPTVIEDVKANRARIVIMLPHEGRSGTEFFENDLKILDSWTKKYNLNKEHVYYVHGNIRGQQLCSDFNFTYIAISAFHEWVDDVPDSVSKYEPMDCKNLFLSYNRQPRWHRTNLMCELIRNNLFNSGLISYHGGGQFSAPAIKIKRPELLPMAQYLDTIAPLAIDMDLIENNPARNLVKEHYNQTFLSLITETLVNENSMFFSEKTWKTIAVGHPFIMLSNPGALAELQKQGYQTFHLFWNENYDTIPDLYRRTQAIITELTKLSTCSSDELHNMRERMQPILQFNQELFRTQWKAQSQRKMSKLFDVIENIWDTF